MYLSRLILNPRSRSVRRDVAHPYEMHRTLMRGFPDRDDGGARRVLWRLDAARAGRLTLYVQSHDGPDWSFLVGEDDYLLDPRDIDLENPAAKEVNFRFSEGQMLTFRLRANPTVKRDGKRLGLLTEAEQTAWLADKAKRSGFQPRRATIVPEGFVRDRKGRNPNARPLAFYAVRYDGHLLVTDPETFRRNLEAGVGSGKAMGFGLMSLARP